MSDDTRLKDCAHTAERRRYIRQDVLFSSAEIEKSNGGILLNISEGGVAVHASSEILTDELLNLRFQISLADPWIETKGRIVWRSHSKRTAGVQFIDLPEPSRQTIRNWLSQTNELCANDNPNGAKSAIAEEPAPHIHNAVVVERTSPNPTTDLSRLRMPFQQRATANEPQPRRRRGSLLYIAGGLLVLGAGAYLVSRDARDLKTTGTLKTARPVNASAGSSATSVTDPQSSLHMAIHQRPTAKESEFVLQVAAFKDERSALVLADRLRQQNFSVFVTQSRGNDLYRVLVGPYGDAAIADGDAMSLKKQGFSSIRQENKPVP